MLVKIPPASAGESQTKQKLFEARKTAAYALYEEQKYEEAIVEFEKAFAIIPDPKIWYNLGQCHRQLNHVEQAILYYEKFLQVLPNLKELPEAKKRQLKTDVDSWLEQLKKQKEEEDARVREEEERRRQEEAKLQERKARTETPSPETNEKKPETSPPPPEPPRLTNRWWFWTGIGATAIFTGATVWAGLRARDYNDKWQQVWDTDYRDKAQLYQNITDAALAGAVVSAAVTGIATWLFLREPRTTPANKPAAWILPSCDTTHCLLQFSFSY